MLTFLDFLMGWASGWTSSGRTTPSVSAQLGDATVNKRSAWLQVEGDSVAGQVTVWESGECELEAYRVDTSDAVVLEHRQIRSLEELESAIRTVVAACEGVPS